MTQRFLVSGPLIWLEMDETFDPSCPFFLQDLLLARSSIGGQVNVEVDAAPQEDMSVTLATMREHYEAVANKNRKALEVWFQAKVDLPSLT